jgi:hypothetical protein
MPRTEKRFGVVNQPTASTPTELVPTAATTRNVLINTTARTTAAISAAIYSGVYSNDVQDSLNISSIPSSNIAATTGDEIIYTGKDDVYLVNGSTGRQLLYVDPNTLSASYTGNTNETTVSNWWRQGMFGVQTSTFPINFKGWVTTTNSVAKLTRPYVLVSSTRAIAIAADWNSSATANSDMFDAITITHTVGTSITESNNDVGQTSLQGGAADSLASHTGGAWALQDGVGYLFHCAGSVSTITSGKTALGIYIYSNSSTSFGKRAYWSADGTAAKTYGAAMAYFILSDYNSVNQSFAFSQPSTTTLWSGISPTSSTSWPAGYALPSEAAPAGFRIVSNSGTTEPDVNFLTGAITYPAAPTGVTVPTGNFPVSALRFSPSGQMVAVAYRRNYSGSGDTNSVVVIYTRQEDGSWLHTASSGSAIPNPPENPHFMEWSGDGSFICISGTSTSTSNVIDNPAQPPTIYLWRVGNGTNNFVSNASVNSWLVNTQKYPEFYAYLKPTSGSSKISSTSVTALIGNPSNTVNQKYLGSINYSRSTTGNAGQFVISVNNITDTNRFRAAVMQSAGTVGISGQTTATNYVTTVVSDLSLTAGQTSQVSNIVLGSGERVYVESSVSNAIDISAHGIENT